MLIDTFFFNGFKISIYDSLDHNLIGHWDETASSFLNSSYLKFIEESRPVNLTFRYVLIQNKHNEEFRNAGVIYFQLLRFTNKSISLKNPTILSFITGLILRLRSFQFLICGNLFAVNFPAIHYKQDVLEKKDILGILSEIQNKIKTDLFFLKDLSPAFTPEIMMPFGWKSYTSDLTMTLELAPQWNSFENYLKSLAKKYRKRAEKIVVAADELQIREMEFHEIKDNIDRIGELFGQVVSKQTVRLCLIDKNYFLEFKRRFPETFSFFGYFFNNELVGFATYIEHEDELEIHYIGIDYRYNERLKIYFKILLDAVKLAIDKKKKTLELGRTAREAKANIGGKPVYFNDYFSFKSRLASLLSDKVINYFQTEPGYQWNDRHPFRK